VETAQQAAWRGRSWPWLVVSLAAYATLVSGAVRHWVMASDRLGCVDPHALTEGGIALAGVVWGLGLGPMARPVAQAVAARLLPTAPLQQREAYVRGVATALVVLGMAVDLLWILPNLNLFVDRHVALAVETHVLVYLMGVAAGAAWYVLWPRQAWMGLLVNAAMTLMVVSSVLSQHAWC
jgi:hypothetical protein